MAARAPYGHTGNVAALVKFHRLLDLVVRRLRGARGGERRGSSLGGDQRRTRSVTLARGHGTCRRWVRGKQLGCGADVIDMSEHAYQTRLTWDPYRALVLPKRPAQNRACELTAHLGRDLIRLRLRQRLRRHRRRRRRQGRHDAGQRRRRVVVRVPGDLAAAAAAARPAVWSGRASAWTTRSTPFAVVFNFVPATRGTRLGPL
jgi:hypothetical protein